MAADGSFNAAMLAAVARAETSACDAVRDAASVITASVEASKVDKPVTSALLASRLAVSVVTGLVTEPTVVTFATVSNAGSKSFNVEIELGIVVPVSTRIAAIEVLSGATVFAPSVPRITSPFNPVTSAVMSVKE